jgi:hypothetical protein
MNIILSYPEGNKILIDSTIEAGVSLAVSLSLPIYNVSTWTATEIYVNNIDGVGFTVNLTENSTVTRLMIFDTSESNVTTWISNNFPEATITSMGKNNFTLYSA